MFSGGIDSVACAYQALTEGQRLVLHHIRLANHEGRQDVEDAAVAAVLEWFRNEGLTSFTFSHSVFDYGNMPWIPKDVNVWAFVAAILLASPKHRIVKSMIVPRHVDAFGHVSDPAKRAALAARSNQLIHGYQQMIAGRQVSLEFPIGKLRKPDIMALIPPELLERCWWCRKPVEGKPCHKCITCVQVDPVLGAA